MKSGGRTVAKYVDASSVLDWLLAGRRPEGWSGPEIVVSSELLRVELFRVLDRNRLAGDLDDAELAARTDLARDFLARCHLIQISGAVLDRAAAPYRTAIGTLDAIHLATALLWQEENDELLLFLTRDRQLATAAVACGLDVRAR